MSAKQVYQPTKEEENILYLATGFRFTPAIERGFPYPWCAKIGKKGWVIRSCPPPPRIGKKFVDRGVEIKGWTSAHMMFSTMKELQQREKKKEKKMSIGTGPIKKRYVTTNPHQDESSTNICQNRTANDWLHNTQQVLAKRREDEFESFLNEQRKQFAKETKEKKQQRRREEKQRKDEETKRKAEKELADIVANANTLPLSSIRKKHKKSRKMTPKKRTINNTSMQNPINSITLGEDPELDLMIEEIVHEFGQVSEANGGSGVELDDGAVLCLAEAARDVIAHEGMPDLYNNQNLSNGMDVAQSAKASNTSEDEDECITNMIEQLIQDSGCLFDGDARDALKGVATELLKED